MIPVVRVTGDLRSTPTATLSWPKRQPRKVRSLGPDQRKPIFIFQITTLRMRVAEMAMFMLMFIVVAKFFIRRPLLNI